MTIFELEKYLPNGFHDIAIKKMTVDYENKSVSMIVEVDENGRQAELFFSGLQEFKLNQESVFNGDTSLWVTDFGPVDVNSEGSRSEFYFFISNLNAFFNFNIIKAEIR